MSKEMLELADQFEEKGSDILFDLSAEKINLIVAALRASAVAEPVARLHRTIRFVLDKDEDLSQFSIDELTLALDLTGYDSDAHPAPAAPVPASVALLEMIKKRLADLREANAIYRKSEWYRLNEIQRNDREIRWLVDLNTLLHLPAPEAAPTREEIIEQCAKVCNRWIKSKNVHESLAADDIAKAILALKAAPAK